MKHREVKSDMISEQENKVGVNRQGLKHPETLLPHTMTIFSTKNSRVPDKLKVSRTQRTFLTGTMGRKTGRAEMSPKVTQTSTSHFLSWLELPG